MKFGVREICDVVLKAKANQKVGNKIFYKNEPVIYFDTLKTSSMEGAATTVYAQGGRGNSRLMAWEGERTVTFTMEDALISPAGFMILSGAGLIDAEEETIYVHATETVASKDIDTSKEGEVTITLGENPAHYEDGKNNGLSAKEDYVYVMILDANGEVDSEPFIPATITENKITIKKDMVESVNGRNYSANDIAKFAEANAVLVDYYVAKTENAQQIDITPDKFGGNYYLEASTLFRDAATGVDMPAEFIIPNCKIQSNFTFTMASSGDPSSFTFTMDAFPGYTRFDNDKKVLAAIQIIDTTESDNEFYRLSTKSTDVETKGIFSRADSDPTVADDGDPTNDPVVAG